MAVVDFLFEVSEMPSAAKKYIAHNAQTVGGGGAANAACAIAKLGGRASLAARVGRDTIGDLIIADLKRHAVDCSLIIATDQGRSSYSSVLLDAKGERQIVNFRGSDLSDDTRLIESATPDAVLADTRWSAGAVAAMRLARDRNIPGVLDAEAPVDFKAMELASHIAFSRQGLESLAGPINGVAEVETALRNVAESFPAWLAMTDGADGVYSLHKGRFSHEGAAAVDVVDTLGAGDVWHGAFAYSLSEGANEAGAVKYANASATLKCSRPGGGRACPDSEEVRLFLRDHGG